MRRLSELLMSYWPIPVCMLLSAFFVYFPITDADIFWHLAAGREIAARHAFIHADPFAYSLASPRWIDLHWLFQLIVYGLYRIGSYPMLLGFKLAAVGATAFLLCRTHRGPRYAAIAAFLSAALFYAARYLLDVRPILITLLCMAVFVYLFERNRRTGKKAALWWCVPLQVVWTNSQGLYMIGLFIVAAYLAESVVRSATTRRRFPVNETLLLAACAAACLVNPYGVNGLRLPLTLFSRITPGGANIYSLAIPENVPLFDLTGYDAVYRNVASGLALLAGLLFAVNRRRARVSHLILFCGFGALAVAAVRNVPLFFVAAIPIVSLNLSELLRSGCGGKIAARFCRSGRYAAIGGALAIVATLLVRQAAVVSLYPPHQAISPFRFPEQAVDYLRCHPTTGNLFNDMRYGGYLIWRLYPEKKVFIDTRLVIRSPGFFAGYLALSENPELFDAAAQTYGITQVLLPTGLYSLHGRLIRHLYGSGAWRLVFTDGTSVLFVRSDRAAGPGLDLSDEATVRGIEAKLADRWAGAPEVGREALGYIAELVHLLR